MNFKNIIIPSAADDCVVYAAEKLKEYISKVTGVTLGISTAKIDGNYFSIGKAADINDADYEAFTADIKGDGYGIFSRGGNIYLAAKTSRGLMYSAYGYVEKYLGVRFLTAEAEYIPGGDIVLPKEDFVTNPDFAMRTYLVGDTFQEHADFDHIARTGVVDLFTDVDERHGGQKKVYGRNCNHNFHLYCPFEVYGNEHPEFYRFFYVNGQITPTIDLTSGITDDGKLDESLDISVAKIVISEMKKDLEKYPEAEVFCFTQEDGPYYFDSDKNRELEKKYKRSGILIRFCNVIVRELNKYLKESGSERKIKLMTFAYDYAKEAPVKTENGKTLPIDDTVRADDDLIIQMALFRNGFYGYFSDKQYPHIKKAFKEWPCVAKDFWFWSYDANFHRYLAYYDSVDNISDNVRGFKERCISYLCINGSYETRRIWQSNIRAYVYRKCMWDTSLDCNALADEYLRLYYKEGAGAVKAVMDLFHENNLKRETAGEEVRCENCGTDERPEGNPEKLLYKAINLIKSGETAIKNSNKNDGEKHELLRRLAEVKATPLMLLYDNFYFYHSDASDEEYQEARKAFFDVAEEAGIDYVAENWTLKQYSEEAGTSEKFVKLGEKDERYNRPSECLSK